MQPEPLLYLGLTNGDLGNPLGYTGLYAGGKCTRTDGPEPGVGGAGGGGGGPHGRRDDGGGHGRDRGDRPVDPQGSQQLAQAAVDTADFVVQNLRNGMSSVATAVGAGLSDADSGSKTADFIVNERGDVMPVSQRQLVDDLNDAGAVNLGSTRKR